MMHVGTNQKLRTAESYKYNTHHTGQLSGIHAQVGEVQLPDTLNRSGSLRPDA